MTLIWRSVAIERIITVFVLGHHLALVAVTVLSEGRFVQLAGCWMKHCPDKV